jgi:GR25 family glycosyltransferase involved in LPS biosynthesis
MDFVDAILYINLEHRKDRLENITEQLITGEVAQRLPIPVEKIQRVDAVHNKRNGAAGCGSSHVKALDLALEKGWECVAIFEDDFAWKNNTDYILECLRSPHINEVKWDVLLLTTNKKPLRIIKDGPGNMQRVTMAQTTSGYIVKGPAYMKKIRDCFQGCIANLNAGRPRCNHAIDMVWRGLQPKGNWYCFKGQIGKQIDSYSDIAKRVVKFPSNIF